MELILLIFQQGHSPYFYKDHPQDIRHRTIQSRRPPPIVTHLIKGDPDSATSPSKYAPPVPVNPTSTSAEDTQPQSSSRRSLHPSSKRRTLNIRTSKNIQSSSEDEEVEAKTIRKKTPAVKKKVVPSPSPSKSTFVIDDDDDEPINDDDDDQVFIPKSETASKIPILRKPNLQVRKKWKKMVQIAMAERQSPVTPPLKQPPSPKTRKQPKKSNLQSPKKILKKDGDQLSELVKKKEMAALEADKQRRINQNKVSHKEIQDFLHKSKLNASVKDVHKALKTANDMKNEKPKPPSSSSSSSSEDDEPSSKSKPKIQIQKLNNSTIRTKKDLINKSNESKSAKSPNSNKLINKKISSKSVSEAKFTSENKDKTPTLSVTSPEKKASSPSMSKMKKN